MTREEEILKRIFELTSSKSSNPLENLLYSAGYMDGAVWADAHPHWISVEDKLPQEHEWILGFSLKRSYLDVYNFDSNGLIEAHDITHWMPMPEAPTVAKNATVKKGGEG